MFTKSGLKKSLMLKYVAPPKLFKRKKNKQLLALIHNHKGIKIIAIDGQSKLDVVLSDERDRILSVSFCEV